MLFERVGDLPLRVDGTDLELRERDTSSGFTRATTIVTLHGDGDVGRGEDVTYETDDHEAFVAAGLPELSGEWTFAEFSARLDDVDLFPEPPDREVFRAYRRWSLESAALDLALRQAETDLATALNRTYDPVRFVVSTRLGEPPSTDRLEALLEVHDDLEFKLDPTTEWTPELAAEVAAVGGVRILDLKGQYEGTDVDAEPDPGLYRLLVETFPDAVLEDPGLTGETRPLLEDHEERISWDAIVHGVEDLRDLPFEPRWLNVKPSRFGTVESLFETIEYCLQRDVRLYGGGQFELGVGRRHLHALASIFYPDGPNDVAPGGYNDPELADDLPASPLSPPDSPAGLDWD
ncbi:MAG: hypothetical protein V5A46_10365 [Haloferacaceae archaeon]